MEKKIASFEIINHGPDNHQYFQGYGTSSTKYDFAFTGIGDNAKEAYNDAVENITSSGYDCARLPVNPKGIRQRDKLTKDQRECGEVYWYVTIRIEVKK